MFASTLTLLLGTLGGLSLVAAVLYRGDETPTRPGIRNTALSVFVTGVIGASNQSLTPAIAYGIGCAFAIAVGLHLYRTDRQTAPRATPRTRN
jgi:hypothetical protein